MTRGRFIAFEGGEGSGKTTQITKLACTLSDQGIEVITTREPGGTDGGEDIRDLLKKGHHARWDGISEALLLYAARHDHAEKLIKPALQKGTWVLCDRFSDSSFAYQGFGRGIGLEKIESLHHLILGDFFPDLTFVFDIEPKDSHARAQKRQQYRQESDRLDDLPLDFHERVYGGYMAIAEKYAHRCKKVDATASIDALHSEIFEHLKDHFGFDF